MQLDATNIAMRMERDGDQYVLDGRKWWPSGVGDPRCRVYIVMGKSNPDAPRHAQHAMIVAPAGTPGITVKRSLTIFGYDDAPHGHMEILFENVRVPAANMLAGEGRGFEVAQGRLGPGRIHHCMRSIGVAERALELMCKRLNQRVAFGKPLATQSVWHERIAEARCMIDQNSDGPEKFIENDSVVRGKVTAFTGVGSLFAIGAPRTVPLAAAAVFPRGPLSRPN